MSSYGTHPTQYCNLNNDTLYAMYRESVYSKLSEKEKLDLLQETVNRNALELGELGSPRIEFTEMASNISGNTVDGVIYVNRDMAVRGIQAVEYQGQIIQHSIDDYNIQSLNTVLHENDHCFQDQVIDGTIQIDNTKLAAEYQANHFTESAVLQDQNYYLGSQYLTGETPGGYYLYYFQTTERDAYLYAEKKTETILQGITEKYGTEPSFEAYEKSVAATGYAAREREAVQLFQNPNFVKDLNQILQNQYFGTNNPVDSAMEKVVKAEMVETCRVMQQITNKNQPVTMEDTRMSFDYKPVTLDEYNQSLRDTVNAYYVHARNDPSMSKEDALKSTGEMAEKYLEAVEEFQQPQNIQIQASPVVGNNAENIAETTGITGLETGSTVGDGLSNGENIETDTGTTSDVYEDSAGIVGGEGCDDGLDS